MSNLEKSLDFILELDQLKSVYRQALVKPDGNRRENSAEHSWHVAMVALSLHEYVDELVDIQRVIYMLLIHDIVEIDAGDTFGFASPNDLEGQREKEVNAANRIFGLLPQKQAKNLKSLWFEFEEAKTPDARFAKAMDRVLPLLQNIKNNGGSWVKHEVKRSQVLKRNKYIDGLAPKLWEYVCLQIDISVQNGWLLED